MKTVPPAAVEEVRQKPVLTVPVSGGTFSYNLERATIMTPRRFKLRLMIGTLALVAGSCGGDDIATPTEGSISIQTTTSGSDLDADGYTVTLEDHDVLPIGVSDEVVIEEVGLGRYLVTLAGLAANCTTGQGENPQTVDVVGGETVTVTFEVTCATVDGGGGGPTE